MAGLPTILRTPAYNVENFIYNEDDNTYTCPQGHTLTTNGTWHKTSNGSQFQQYKTKHCKTCPVREKCTSFKQNGKIVQRRKNAQNIEHNNQRTEKVLHTYKKRQAIVEHPYGTIKRQWGFCYIITKRYLERASADVGFMMVACNLRRIINIIGINHFKEYLEKVISLLYCKMGIIESIKQILRPGNFQTNYSKVIYKLRLKWLYLSQNYS